MQKLLCAAALKVRINEDNIVPGTNIRIDDCLTFFHSPNKRPYPLNSGELREVFNAMTMGMYAFQEFRSMDNPHDVYITPPRDLLIAIIHNIASIAPKFGLNYEDEAVIFLHGDICPNTFRNAAQKDALNNTWYPSDTISNMRDLSACPEQEPINKMDLWPAANMRAIQQVQQRFQFGALEHDSPAIPLLISAQDVQAYFLD